VLVLITDRSLKHVLRARRAVASAPLDELKAGFLRTLGHPARIRILEVLADGERSVGELIPRIGVEASTLSQHLGVLRRAGIVVGRRDGHKVIYALASPELADMVGLARMVLAGTLAHRADLLDNLQNDADNDADSAAAWTTMRSGRTVEHATVGGDL
jgi:DNA-binding transcriptional ArsR family regulator